MPRRQGPLQISKRFFLDAIKSLPPVVYRVTNMKRNLESKSGAGRSKQAPIKDQAELEVQLAGVLGRVPPLIRLPRPKQRCPYSSLSRSGFYEIVAPCRRNNFKPPVPGNYLKSNPRAQRGIWLVSSERLFRFLLGLAPKPVADDAAAGAEVKP